MVRKVQQYCGTDLGDTIIPLAESSSGMDVTEMSIHCHRLKTDGVNQYTIGSGCSAIGWDIPNAIAFVWQPMHLVLRWSTYFFMALNIIFVLLLLSCKITIGYRLHHAGYRTFPGEYYGAQAKISAWGVPQMNPNSRYEVSINLLSLEGTRVRLLKTGLHVFPKLYNNTDLRFFTSANADASRDYACYNMDNCSPAFILANSSVALYPGQAVVPLSQYDGEDRSITLSIKQDVDTLLWTVSREDFGTRSIIGWWENGTLGDLDNKAENVQFMAFVAYEDNDTGTSMGSGHYPEEGPNKAAYMMDLKIWAYERNEYNPKISTLIRSDDKNIDV
ncbi:protein neprosin-like [Carex rostrata]